MLIFQDRLNTQNMTISGGSNATLASGSIYAPTSSLTVSGGAAGATYDSQFIVGTLTVTGGSAAVSITPPAGQSNLVYLVE